MRERSKGCMKRNREKKEGRARKGKEIKMKYENKRKRNDGVE